MDNKKLEQLVLENTIQTRVNTKALEYIINKNYLNHGQDINVLIEEFKIEIGKEYPIVIKK